MGLDVYFYQRDKKENKESNISGEEVLDSLYKDLKTDKEFLESLSKFCMILRNKKNDKVSVKDLINKAISQYIYKEEDYGNYADEVAYFRKFWFIVHFFEYTDEYYGEDKLISKDELELLVETAENTIKKVQSELIRYKYDISKDFSELISTDLTEEQSELADSICMEALGSTDSFIFEKIKKAYSVFKDILLHTDFNNSCIVMNANW